MTTMQRAFPAPVIPKFFTNNVCVNYQLRRFFNGQDDFICAQSPFHTQTIASQSEKDASAPSLAIAFANIDENDKTQVLAFCNAYGLPYSSQRCLSKRAHLDDENHSMLINDFSFIDTTLFMGDILVEKDYAANDAEVTLNYTLFEVDEMDIMSLRLFARCVKIVRSLLIVQSYLIRHEGTQAGVIYALAYLLHYSARGIHYLLPRIKTPTLKAAEYFATRKRISHTQLLKSIRKADADYACQLQNFLAVVDKHMLHTLADYDKDLLTKKQLTAIILAEDIPSISLDHTFARRVLLDIINDNIIPPDRKWTWRKKNLPVFGNAAILCRQFILIYISCCSIRANTIAVPIQNAAIIFSSADAVQTNATAAIAVLPKWASKAKHIDRIKRNEKQIQATKKLGSL